MSTNNNESSITKLEKGRAEFAYKCALEGKQIITKSRVGDEWYEDNKYKSYVKKIPSMILSNGLGQTLAFIVAKGKKQNDKGKPGSEGNPKNAYDLIYKQLTDYLRSDSTIRINMPNNTELIKWIISLPSNEYRYVTEELLAFLHWLKKFAEGIIEEGEDTK